MALNVDKTNYIVFNTREKNIPKYQTMIVNGINNINEVEYTNNLCILIYDNKTWNFHSDQA